MITERAASKVVQGRAGVDLWIARTGALPADLETLVARLPRDERATAARIRAAERRRQFIAGRIVLRSVLGGYVGRRVAVRPFHYLTDGKPVLAEYARGVHFNLAHSGDVILAGVSTSGPVGVDVERVRPVPQLAAIASSWFTAAERAWLDATPEHERTAAFLLLWTCREAVTKAAGHGISRGWNSFEIAMRGRAGAGAASSCGRWSVVHPTVAAGYVASMATDWNEAPVHTFEWTASTHAT